MSKQHASMNHEEKTRKQTDWGEKPKFAEYFVMVQLLIRPTTVESHGHSLGIAALVM